MSGIKVKAITFLAPADFAAPGALDGVVENARLLADTLYLEREGLPGNLSALSQRIIALAPLAASDTRSAAELMACIVNINRLLLVWPALKTAEASKRHGANGGCRHKKRKWAKAVAKRLASTRHASAESAWQALPSADNPWLFEADEFDFEVYIDGDSVIAVDDNSRKELGSLKKSTFLKIYYRPARKAGR
ncbi:hypothetical protein N5C93_12735 [Pseudomonas nitroreducens]|uniref:hypothetical protein n=1 Tax=Pseudomonas TaxID=286 RepID=UPI0007EE4748|nr:MULTISPECIES: hypothetical protein [Pseudomonas]MDG9856332.1 hypothetical protein [Pseudomonas nitroreducens]MDH1073700.1 hypothetical protein [Pseudomonas nitroreducens]NMZ71648.1 hypothetical protein [Pseudomonas nitroreducens]OBY55807.1 hypothetical protein A9513_011155 [Pseudomonas sp. AU12215]UCL86694.1 hypothetical protein LDJ84_27875 [Pseudomonas sp. HS-18]